MLQQIGYGQQWFACRIRNFMGPYILIGRICGRGYIASPLPLWPFTSTTCLAYLRAV